MNADVEMVPSHHNILSRPVFSAESNGAIGGSIFVATTDVSAVAAAAAFYADFRHITASIIEMDHKEVISFHQTLHNSKLGVLEVIFNIVLRIQPL
mgnify:CR=1 FL=1